MNITVDELQQHLTDGVIIDLRSIEKYNNHHIPFSINIPYSKLASNFGTLLDKNVIYYLYCEKGLTSSKLCAHLRKYGYQVYNVLGGYEEWIIKND